MDCLRRLQVAATHEDAKVAEQRLFLAIEQVVAPCNRVAERLLSSRGIASTPRQQLQSAFEWCQHRPRLEQAAACRGQLNGQWQPVQAPTDFGHCCCIFACQREIVPDRAAAFDI